MNNEDDIIQQITNDDFYASFLNNDNNSIPPTLTFVDKVKKLGDAIDILNKELQKQVLENHDDLLRQASHATKLENVLYAMSGHVQNLFANAERLRRQISVPCEQLETHTTVLERLYKASHILRQVSRVQQLSRKLSSTNDPTQKATFLQELEQLAVDPELTDIDVITTELRNVRIQQQNINKLASSSLNLGIINKNPTQTCTALQIFINLGTIKTIISNLIKQNVDECRKILKQVLDTNTNVNVNKSGTGPGRVQLTTSHGFRNKIWNELETSFAEDIYEICDQIKFLQNTLNESHVQNVNYDGIAIEFWNKFGQTLQEEIKASSPATQQMLEEDYPRFLKNYCEMHTKLNFKEFSFNRAIFQKLEDAYLSISVTKILDPVQAMFSGENKISNHDDIDALIRIITSELSLGLIEEHLTIQIAKNVTKCIKMFSVKTEQQIETGADAAQVIGGSPNAGQKKNVQHANSLYYLRTQVQRMLTNMKDILPEKAANIINESLESLNVLTSVIMQPLVVSVNSVIETIIVTMHLEPDWTKIQPSPSKQLSGSPYMRELVEFISRVYNTYFIYFQNKEVLLEKCNEIALRCIELLVRHASILRPIGQGGRQRLQIDFHLMENALKLLCPQLATLGRPYRLLNSMASVITQSAEEIVTSQTRSGGGSIPHSTILFLLFSYAGTDLASPHQNTGWSLPKLSVWLDEHSNELDRLDLAAGALQKYENFIRQNNSTNYDPVYPIMCNFLEVAMKEHA